MNVNLGPLIPELMMAALGLGLLIADLFVPAEKKRTLGWISILGLLAVLATLYLRGHHDEVLLSGAVVLDSVACFFRFFFVGAAILVTFIAMDYLDRFPRGRGEYFAIIVLATLAMMLLGSTGDFISLFICLETMTVSFYVMAAYERTRLRSSEAALKYLILGALSAGFLLYGMSFVYGATGSLNLEGISQVLSGSPLSTEKDLLLKAGILLIIVGVGFKIGSVPFHVWVPDVYQGAPTPTTAFLAVGSKAAGFAVLIRVFGIALWEMRSFWGPVFLVLGTITLVYGNLAAIPQKNIKRMLGYSSIGHSGYLMLGVGAASFIEGGTPVRADGIAALLFYLLTYLFTNAGIFLIVSVMGRKHDTDEMDSYDGLSRRSPFAAMALFICLMSLAGVPPLGGFFGKFMVLTAIYEQGILWVFFIGVAYVVVSMYYYLCVIKRAYIHEPGVATDPVRIPGLTKFVTAVCLVLVVAMGIVQNPFWRASKLATKDFAYNRQVSTERHVEAGKDEMKVSVRERH